MSLKSLLSIFKTPERVTADKNIPEEFIQFASTLSSGQMIPMRTEMSLEGNKEPFLSFIIKERDKLIRLTKNDPLIDLSYGCVTFKSEKNIFILFLLVRIDGRSEMTYETAFSLSEEQIYSDCSTLSQQSGIQIIFIGDKEKSIVATKVDQLFHQNIAACIEIASSNTKLNWTQNEFIECVNAIYSKASSPNELWHFLEDNGSFLEVSFA